MRIHEYGDASVIRQDDVPRPVPGRGEVLIHVAATSFNPSEIGLRRGLLRAVFAPDLPFTLGAEVAGTVVEVGDGGHGLAVGDRVIGRVGGAAAEYVTARADTVVAAPTAIPLTHAAAIPVAGVTAWQAVFEHAGLTSGQRVLVNGAGGGVGGFAVQLAKHAGAHVVATASPRSAEAVSRFGADQIVDYTAIRLADAVDGPVDAILNLVVVDARQAAALARLVRPGGVVVSATAPVEVPTGSPVRAVRFVARNDVGDLAALVRLVDAGTVRVDVAASRPLDELASVHRDAESGRIRGKIILVPSPGPSVV
ncbi:MULTISPECIES: NADP-dependent oxidoreductase [Micromonospora]|uniref:NADP-dependent oxidoreductase n=1 Tax=Micromonospora TaxID=1873 RepID=UPI0018E9ED63|nr:MULTISPECIES: NADP-dependent oxidoreductase [unclassified Micromonospora]MDI5940846.1 NADP-dependent oxidoreductase [Micromonospora sp. DH15]